jgi:lysophospholipase L1-like esterase
MAYYAPVNTAAALTFNSGAFVYNQADIFITRSTSTSNVTIDRAGTAPTSGGPITSGTPGAIKVTFNWATAGAGNLNISNVVGGVSGVFIQGIVLRNTSAPAIEIYNGGIGGSNSTDWAIVTHPSSASPREMLQVIAPDVTFIGHGVNDWNSGATALGSSGLTPIASYKSNIQSRINAARTTGDAILVVPPQSNEAGGFSTVAIQQGYVTALIELSNQNNVPLLNTWSMLSAWPEANTLGYYADSRHPNALGYGTIAHYLSAALRGASSV